MNRPTESPFKGLVYYVRPVPAIRELAEWQYDIMWISEVVEGTTPTSEDVIRNSPEGATGAIFAYLTLN